jgi:hypothetical protein
VAAGFEVEVVVWAAGGVTVAEVEQAVMAKQPTDTNMATLRLDTFIPLSTLVSDPPD